ncbi:MAG: L-threonine 3-dehydrogenase [Gemmatimonadales bacterium]|nr:L-threonine 3-dehydrogenase [bacterium HR33]GIW51859.1 MAG: L-threonine 3-dehydrogenase [Gemmatimonadales bacterium]
MRAIRKSRPAPGLELCEVPEPRAGSGEVLIRVRYAGVCGTDLHIADWDQWAQGRIRPPVVLGHEFAGEIVEVGADVAAEFRVGELVTAEGHIVCGHCRQCRMGDAHICQNTRIIGVDRDGAFADLVAVPAGNVVALNGIPATTGAIMDPLGNAFHAVLAGNAVSGATVLVLGCGPIGCFAVGVAKAAGAASIIASDINPRRLELARTMGAHHVLDARSEDVPRRVAELTRGEGADLVLEMSGSAEAVKQAFGAVRLGGRVHLLGLPKGEVALELSSNLIFKGVTVYGVIGRRMFETWHQMQSFLSSGLLDPTPVITHRFPLEAIDDALHAIRSGEAGKVILEIGS